MGNAALKSIKSQSLIEATMMMVAGIILLLGVFRIGLWYNNEVSERQPAYNSTRLTAGNDQPGEWPVYRRGKLTEDWVFGRGDFEPGTEQDGNNSTTGDRNSDCVSEAAELQQQALEKTTQADALSQEAKDLENEAVRLDDEAEALDAKAEGLDQQAQEQQELYDNCMASCEYMYYDCSSCQPYLDQANEYKQDASDARQQAADDRQQAADDRRDARDKRNDAQDLRQEAEDLNQQAEDILENCPD